MAKRVGIMLEGNGPGSGPVLPPSLYTLGGGYSHRWHASRLGASGSAVGDWADDETGQILTPAAAGWTVTTVGSEKVITSTGTGGSLTSAIGSISGPMTIAVVCRIDPSLTQNTATRELVNYGGIVMRRAGNGQFGIAGSAGILAAGGGTFDNWLVFMAALEDLDADGAIESGEVAASYNTSEATAPSPNITRDSARATLRLKGSVSGVTCLVGEVIVWPTMLDATSRANRYAEIAAGWALV